MCLIIQNVIYTFFALIIQWSRIRKFIWFVDHDSGIRLRKRCCIAFSSWLKKLNSRSYKHPIFQRLGALTGEVENAFEFCTCECFFVGAYVVGGGRGCCSIWVNLGVCMCEWRNTKECSLPRTGSVPCDRGVGERVREADLQPRQREAFIRLAQEVVDAIWLDLGALNQGYPYPI